MERITYKRMSGDFELKQTETDDPCEYCYEAVQRLGKYEELEEKGCLIKMKHRLFTIVLKNAEMSVKCFLVAFFVGVGYVLGTRAGLWFF